MRGSEYSEDTGQGSVVCDRLRDSWGQVRGRVTSRGRVTNPDKVDLEVSVLNEEPLGAR